MCCCTTEKRKKIFFFPHTVCYGNATHSCMRDL
jgi:hypothetical protein